jgi:hypothetical protein
MLSWTSLKVISSLPLCSSLGVLLTLLPSTAARAQGNAVPANAILLQLSSAFSGGKPIRTVEITGNASWHAGSLNDSGTVTLKASADSSSQMQLQLAATGPKNEALSGASSNAACQWSGADAVSHEIDFGNCLQPAVWFLPALSLQPALASSTMSAVDLGTGPVGSGSNSYRHVQTQLMPGNLPIKMANSLAQRSTEDLGMDPTSLLPAVLTYSVHPDNGANVQIAVEVRYSDYRAVSGVQIPFHIQRLVNGTLQLDILVSSVQIN